MIAWFTALAVLAGFYYYFLRNLDYFKRHGIPHPRPQPIFGNSAGMLLRRKSFPDAIKDVYRIDGRAKYVGMFDFTTPTIVLRDPDLIKSVAVKHFDHFTDHQSFTNESADTLFGKNLFSLRGEKWKDMRTLLSPAFTASKMRVMFRLMNECSARFADYWQKAPAEARDCVDTKAAFTRYTNDVIATCAFGITVDSLRDPDNDFYVYGKNITKFTFLSIFKFILILNFPRLSSLLRVRVFSKKAGEFFKSVVESTINARDELGITRPDMIQLMMESRGKRGEKELTIEDMTSQAFIFFFGGFDSSSTAMCFAAQEIAVNPHVYEKVLAEVDQIADELGGKDEDVTYEAINKLRYMDAVLSETLRKYPVTPTTDRICVEDFELPPTLPGAKPFLVRKGMSVNLPIYALHMDPEYFPEPEEFRPERFLEECGGQANPLGYMPFGMGPRMCIGNRFALQEIKILLFHLLRRCTLKPCEKTQVPVVFTKDFTMRPEKGFWLKIEPRFPPRQQEEKH